MEPLGFKISTINRFTERAIWLPTSIFLTNAFLYSAFQILILKSDSVSSKLIFGVFAGSLTSTLFIIGHDAAHQTFTSSRLLNRIIGTVTFLPALHPYSLWEYGHNKIHHRFAAQIGKDYGYSPMTVEQYRSAPAVVRLHYRFMRTLIGQPFYYLVDIWLPKMFVPVSRHVGPFRKVYWFDLAVVYGWLALLLLGLAALSRTIGASAPLGWGAALWQVFVYNLLVPFLIWNVFMSFVTIVQHTHPRIRWNLPTGRASTPEQQVHGTARIAFPEPLDWILHRVMQHLAHHIHPGIPMYNLKAAQSDVESRLPDRAIVCRWSPSAHWRMTKACKLYDPKTDRWCGFDGIPTT